MLSKPIRKRPSLCKNLVFFRTCTLILSFLLIFSFFACSASKKTASPTEIAEKLLRDLPDTVDLTPASDRYLLSVFSDDLPLDTPHACYRNNQDGMDEIGVFACNSISEAHNLARRLQDALQKRYELFDDRYFSEERSKFENALSLSDGCYVLYAVASEENLISIKDNFKAILKGTV